MPVLRASDAVVHSTHGSSFHSYVSPTRGSGELCAWRLQVPADTTGVAHRPSREEVLLVLSGTLQIRLDGAAADLGVGDVLLVPANSELSVDSGPDGATAWVTTSVGLQAEMADGSRFSPPWAL